APPRALWLGTGVHKALEHYYDPTIKKTDAPEAFRQWALAEVERIKNDFPGLDEERLQEFADDIELGEGMLQHYTLWAPKHDTWFTVIDVEEKVHVPNFVDDVPLEGRGDMLVQSNADGRYWVVEHKTARVIDTDRLILERQPGVYQYAMGLKHETDIAGVEFNFLRKKLPSVPKLLKSGDAVSKQQVDTTYEVYRDALVEYKLDPGPYQETLDTLKEVGNTFFHRESVVRSQTELDRLMGWLKIIGKEMLSDPEIYPSPDMMKDRMCPFLGPCIALHDGSDYKFMLKQRYQVRRKESVGNEVQSPDNVL
ncbi:hypothetical protein LCGC14_2137180, partial [marine sediment metagenome]